MLKNIATLCICLSLFVTSLADDNDLLDSNIPGYTTQQLLQQTTTNTSSDDTNNYTVIDYNYSAVAAQANEDIQKLLTQLQGLTLAQKIEHLTTSSLILNRPYIYLGAEGEGNWCNVNNKQTCLHIQQDPIFRTDQYNCTTLVTTLLSLLHAHTLRDFNRVIVNVEYGAAGKLSNPIHYYNRNNFISSAFNTINEANHYLVNATFGTQFYAQQTVSSVINVPQWLHFQAYPSAIKNNVRVLNAKNGPIAVHRFQNTYPPTLAPLQPHNVNISYIPKQALVTCNYKSDGTPTNCTPNTTALNALPTPAVIEIVRDDNKWYIGDRTIDKVIGSGINVSHLGILFKKTFKLGDIIYQQITCSLNGKQKICQVTPIKCHQSECHRTMLMHATDAYPNGYYWYQVAGNYYCAANKPTLGTNYTYCNRVTTIPLGNYLSAYEYNSYPYMASPSIVGIHLEKIV